MRLYHTHPVLAILWVLLDLALVSQVITQWVTSQRLKHRIKELGDVFDPGTAFLSDNYVFGSFHGRPAWVSIGRSGLSQAIQIGINGHFSLAFQVQDFNSQKSAGIYDMLVWVTISVMWFYSGVNDAYSRILSGFTMLMLAMTGLYLTRVYEPRRRTPRSITRIDMPLVATRLTPFETKQPDRLRAALDKPEIRESLVRIFDSCRADGLKSRGDTDGINARGEMEAFWRLPRRLLDISLLNTDNVRGMLTELSALCAGAEHGLLDATRI